MKIFFTRLSVALVTFMIGLSIASAFASFPNLMNVSENSQIALRDSRSLQNYLVVTNEPRNIGVFKVFVNSYESSYVENYEKNSHVRNGKNQNDSLERSESKCCPYGLDLQKLEPNKKAKF